MSQTVSEMFGYERESDDDTIIDIKCLFFLELDYYCHHFYSHAIGTF